MECLARPEFARFQMLSYLAIMSAFIKTKQGYNKFYGADDDRVKTKNRGSGASDHLYVTQVSFTTETCEDSCLHDGRDMTRSVSSGDGRLKWAGFPEYPKAFALWRTVTSAWMIYVIIKFVFSEQISALANSLVKLNMPIHCYLVGRFILQENVAEMSAALFSFGHITWRFSQWVAKPCQICLAYFLTLNSEDRDLFYSKLEKDQSIKLTNTDIAQLSDKQKFILDTMCYRVIYRSGVVYRLRSNRTPESHLELCRMVAKSTICALVIVTPIAIVLYLTHTFLYLLDVRYTSVYPNCDPILQALKDSGRLSARSMTIRGHHLLTIFADTIENILIWVECGLVATAAPIMVHLMSQDLVMNWKGIKAKLDSLARTAMLKENTVGLEAADATTKTTTTMDVQWDNFDRAMQPADSSGITHRQMHELSAEMADFFNQVKRANSYLSQYLLGFIVGWLSLVGIYTYFLRTRSFVKVPLVVIAVFAFVLVGLSFAYHSFMRLHRSCIDSYPKLCSLMAREQNKCAAKCGLLIEFYVKKRACFTVMHEYPFEPTTFLTLIGWTFSCFCIITEVIRRNR
jgi:hypothetical protein